MGKQSPASYCQPCPGLSNSAKPRCAVTTPERSTKSRCAGPSWGEAMRSPGAKYITSAARTNWLQRRLGHGIKGMVLTPLGQLLSQQVA